MDSSTDFINDMSSTTTGEDINKPDFLKKKTTKNVINPDDLSGNYLISIGFKGSGKSTFQAALVTWVAKYGDFSLGVISQNDEYEDTTTTVIDNFISSLSNNSALGGTAKGIAGIEKFNLHATPVVEKYNNKPELYLNLLELSGEDIETLSAAKKHEAHIEFINFIERIIINENMKIIFAFVVDPSQDIPAQDNLFRNFMDKIKGMSDNHGTKHMLNNPILLLLSKPRDSIDLLGKLNNENYGLNYKLHESDIKFILQKSISQTFNRLKVWEGGGFFSGLDILSTDLNDKNKLNEFTFLDEGGSDDIETIFKIVYKAFINEELRPSLWIRIKTWFLT